MPSYYRMANAALAKTAHHEAMAEVHGNLTAEYFDRISKEDPRSRSNAFHRAALEHHRRELAHNENQVRDYKGGRSFSSIGQHDTSAHADAEMFHSKQPSHIYDDKGVLMSRIHQIRHPHVIRDFREQGHLQDFRDAGGISPVDPDINRRFI